MRLLSVDERRRVAKEPRPFGRRAGDRVELTDRQQEVLELVADGLENKEIAPLLGISEQGVKQQVSVLLRKFGAPSRAILARNALTMKLLGTSDRTTDIPFEYLFDRAPVLISVTRGPEHRYVLVNRAYVDLFGERGYVGRTYRECFPEAPAASLERLDRLYATGETFSSNERRREFVHPSGQRREVYLSLVTQPTRDPDGSVGGVIFFARDVTQDVALRRQLQRLSAEQAVLLEQLPVGIVYTDEAARPVLVNPVARRILGTGLDPSRPLYDQYGGRVRYASTGLPLAPAEGPSARATAGWPFDEDLVIRAPNGRDIPIHVSARPLHDEQGSVTGAVLVITEHP